MKFLALMLLAAALAPAQSTVEQRLRALEDREEIRTLLLEYGRTLDARDLRAYSELFAQDGEWIGGFGSVKGRAALLEFMRKNVGERPNTAKTYHLLTNFVIEVQGDRAQAWSRWSYVVPNAEKKPVLEHSGRYDDSLIRENGHWRFLKRVVHNDLPPVEP